MYSNIKIIQRYLKYIFQSAYYKGHGVHSPFMYEFVRKVIFEKDKKNDYDNIIKIRNNLLHNNNIVELQDFGAGSRTTKKKLRKISEIAANSAIRHKYGRLLSQLIRYYNPNVILEIGTSLGVSTAYISKDMSNNAILYTIEGDKNLCSIANQNFKNFQNKQIKFINANFDTAIPTLLLDIESELDFVFFDGNHTYSATIRYFEQCLNKINNNSIFVFDDIHWSEDMEKAWKYINNHPQTKVCVDLFQLGFVFFRKELTKQNYIIKYF